MFQVDLEYRRAALHAAYGGQAQGGISTARNHDIILLFTGGQGKAHGNSDYWLDDDTFIYTGEGQRGDMEFLRGNAAIRDHGAAGRELHLFEYTRKGYVRYVGEMVNIDWYPEPGLDSDSRLRQWFTTEASLRAGSSM
jgi:5-methylcytosine-specific restriction enzyme A